MLQVPPRVGRGVWSGGQWYQGHCNPHTAFIFTKLWSFLSVVSWRLTANTSHALIPLLHYTLSFFVVLCITLGKALAADRINPCLRTQFTLSMCVIPFFLFSVFRMCDFCHRHLSRVPSCLSRLRMHPYFPPQIYLPLVSVVLKLMGASFLFSFRSYRLAQPALSFNFWRPRLLHTHLAVPVSIKPVFFWSGIFSWHKAPFIIYLINYLVLNATLCQTFF